MCDEDQSSAISVIFFSWQPQYLVKLERHFFVARAAFREVLEDSWSATCSMFPYKMRRQDGRGQLCEAAGVR